MKHRILVNVAIAVVALAGAGLGARWMIANRPETEVRRPARVVPTVVAPRIYAETHYRAKIIGYGSARARVRLQIIPQVTGEVTDKAPNLLSGQYVRKGQMLFQIDQTDYKLARDSARRNIDLLKTKLRLLYQEKTNKLASRKIETDRLALAEAQLKKAKTLLDRGAGTENEVDSAEETALSRRLQVRLLDNQLALLTHQRAQLEAEIAVAQVQLARAQTDLDRTTIRSPIAGRVLSSSAERFQRVQVGSVCCELYGVKVMEIPISIPADDLSWIEENLLVPGPAQAKPKKKIDATVHWNVPGNGRVVSWPGAFLQRIESGLEAETRTARLVIQVDNPAPESGKPVLDLNKFCKVVVDGKIIPKVFLLPREAIQPDGTVFMVTDGKLARRAVQVARFTDETAYVLPGGGLEDGDRVVIRYIPRPVVGTKVRVVDRPEGTTAPATGPTTRAAPAAAGM